MDDRFPKIILLGLIVITGIVVLISGLGLFDDALPTGDYETEAEPTPTPDPSDRENGADAETTSLGTTGDSMPPPTAPDTRVVVRWRLVTAARLTPTLDELPPLVPEGLVPLPKLHGRIVVKSAEETGGVRDISVVHGTPLSFTQRVSSATSSVFEFKGEGRGARIVSVALQNGETLRRMLNASHLGPAASVLRVAGLGWCRGRVIDAEGQGVVGAIVRIDQQSTTTGADGRFTMERVRGGEPIVSVVANGFAAHREPVATARRFGAEDAPEFAPEIRLSRGRRITIRSRSDEAVSGQVTWHLLPYGYQLQDPHLAVETMTGLRASAGDAVVVEHAPATQPLCLVGVHPTLNHVYRKVPDGADDVEVAVVLTPRRRLTGRVTAERNGDRIDSFIIETSLDGLTTGTYLGAAAKIPTGHRVCNFPLPDLATPIASRASTDDLGEFEIVYDRGASAKIRVSAAGFASQTALAPSRLDTVQIALPPIQTAAPGTIRMSLTLQGNPNVTAVVHRGIDVTADYETEPGRVTQELTGLTPGRYEITIEAAGYEKYDYAVRLEPDGQRRVAAFLTQIGER